MNVPQLPLALRFAAEPRFVNFEPADGEAVLAVRALALTGHERLFLSGPTGSGKTHLLQAACGLAAEHGRRFAFLPLAALGAHAADVLQAQPAVDLLAIDGLERIAGDRDAELALFALHNRQADAAGALLYAADAAPDALPLLLPDLRSRLQQCRRLRLAPLDEAQRRTLLRRRALARGLELDDAVLDYLFRRVGRDLGTLGELLDRIDRASLAAQRRVTVPFVRGLIEP